MTLFIIIIVVLILLILSFNYNTHSPIDDEKLIFQIKELYLKLKQIITTSYDLKPCPRCNCKKMNILNILKSGDYIEYSCDHCYEKITSKLLPDKIGSEAFAIIKEIKAFLSTLSIRTGKKYYKREIDVSFIVSSFGDNLTEDRQRTQIPQSIRHEVWRRDQGKCIMCGSQINLEFDHIIPFSKGGSNTARNIQILCEKCNRKKHANL